MPNDIDNKPLTIKDIREVLIPAMQEVFATKKDLRAMQEVFATKQDLQEFRDAIAKEIREKFDKIMKSSDKILKDIEILMTEKTISYHQRKKEQKLWSIIIDALQEHRILSSDQLAIINKLEVL